jgi:hypothetical protein
MRAIASGLVPVRGVVTAANAICPSSAITPNRLNAVTAAAGPQV